MLKKQLSFFAVPDLPCRQKPVREGRQWSASRKRGSPEMNGAVKIALFHRKTLLICWGKIDPINQECLLL